MGHLHQLTLRGVESRVEAFLLGVLVLLEVLNGAFPRPSAARLGDVLVEVMISKSFFDAVSVEHSYRLVAPRAGAFDSRSHISNLDQRILRVVKLLKPLGEDGAQKSCCWGTGCAVEPGRLGIMTASTWYEEDGEGMGSGEVIRRFLLPSATELESVGEATLADSGVSRGRAAIGNGVE